MKKRIIVIELALALMLVGGCGHIGSREDMGSAGSKDTVYIKDKGNTGSNVAGEIKEFSKTPDSQGGQDSPGKKELTEKSESSEGSQTMDEHENSDNQDPSASAELSESINPEDGQESSDKTENYEMPEFMENYALQEGQEGPLLSDTSDINLTDSDGNGSNYVFTYDGEEYRAVYTAENWKVYDSYKINSETDLLIICQALIDEHPIHGRDMVSFRTAEDMVYEWQIHNLAYALLKDDDPLKDDTRDVDLDPKDQGLSIEEIYKSRTGKDLDMDAIMGLTN